MNKIIPLTILSLAFAWGYSAEGDKPLPKAAADVVAELNASKMLATQKAIKKLQVIMGDLTRKGDLENANLVKAVMDGLQKGLEDSAPAIIPFVKVEWGIGDRWIDITQDIVPLVSKNSLDLTFSHDFDDSLLRKHSDPAPNTKKVIRFTFGNKKTKDFQENTTIHLPSN